MIIREFYKGIFNYKYKYSFIMNNYYMKIQLYYLHRTILNINIYFKKFMDVVNLCYWIKEI